MAKPTDDQIVAAMYGRLMTYVIANILRREKEFKALDTAFVLRRLKAMEKTGRVKRMPSSYSRQLCWSEADPAAAPQKKEG